MTVHTVIAARPAHSEFGGSVASRVKNCAGSVALLRTVPKRNSAVADEGNWAHALAAYCLQNGYRSAIVFEHRSLPLGVEVPPQYSGKICGRDLCEAVNVYLSAVYDELDLSPGAELGIEEDVELGIEGVYGRLDARVWHPTLGRLRTFDYKHGEGMVVDVEDSDQGQFYTCGLLRAHPEWKVLEAVVTIVQPRPWKVAAGHIEAVKDWTVDVVDLALWLADYEDAVEASLQPGAPLKAGPWCRKSFCDAMAVCPAQEAAALSAAQAGFKDVVLDLTQVNPDALIPVHDLDLDRLELLAEAAATLSAYAKQCEAYLETLALNGHATKRFKLVDKIGRRKYVVADDEVADYVEVFFDIPRDVATRTTLQTITELKKILRQHGATKEQVDDFEIRFTLKESSGLTLAPASDKRPAVTPLADAYASVQLP